jgi:hypothetical protein
VPVVIHVNSTPLSLVFLVMVSAMSLDDSIVALCRTGSLLYFHSNSHLVTIRVIEVALFKVFFQTDPSFHMNLLCRSITASSRNVDVAVGGYFASGEEVIGSECKSGVCGRYLISSLGTYQV